MNTNKYKPKRIETYTSDRVLECFYNDLIKAANSGKPDSVLSRVHLPMSDVYYTRRAIELNTGILYSLDRIERCMYLEGMLKAEDVFEPNRKRDFEYDYLP